MRLFAHWLLAVFLLAPAWPAQFAELEKAALEELRGTNTPGMAVAVVSGDKIVLAKGFGVARSESGEPITADTLFRLGSTTKMMTAAVLVGMAEEVRLALDAFIGRYVQGLSPALAQLTAHQLLTHTAGLKDSSPGGAFHDDGALAVLVRSWGDDYLFTRPGDIYSYSNPGFILAEYLIEQLGGKPYAELMRERLFEPLGMSRTTLRPTVAMTYPLAQGHHAAGAGKPTVERPFYDNSGRWPAGSVFTSANDFARFAIAFMNGGQIDGRQGLSPSVIKKLAAPHVKIPDGSQYGYGLRLREYRGVHLVQHGGSLPGFVSLLRMAPEHRFAVVALANRGGGSVLQTAEKAMELLLPLGRKPPPGPARPAAIKVRGADGKTEYVFAGGRAKKVP